MMYLISVAIRLTLSLTVGLPFFIIGSVFFLLLDILFPRSDKGYQALNLFFKWGSFYWFKGLRMETDSYDISVSKHRADKANKP